MGEDSLLARVTAAANERQLSQNTLTAYRLTILHQMAWVVAEEESSSEGFTRHKFG